MNISVVMPVYNAGQFLAPAVESILAQTWGDFEFMIFDDGSSDGSSDILRGYAARDRRIKLTVGEHRGYTEWLSKGLSAAAGALVARMDSDDVALPRRFATQVAYMESHPDVVVVGGQALVIDPDGDPIYRWEVPLGHEEIDGKHLSGRAGMLIHPTVVMRRAAVIEAGGYRKAFEPAEDFDLWLRLGEIGRLANLAEDVLRYRVHVKSVSKTRCASQWRQARAAVREARARRGLEPREDLVEDLVPADLVPPDEVGLLVEWIWRARDAGNHWTARKLARQLVRGRPLSAESWRMLARALGGDSGRRMVRSLRGIKIVKANGSGSEWGSGFGRG